MKTRKDVFKRDRIAKLLAQGVETSVIVERMGCNKDLVYQVRKEMKGEKV